MLVIGISPHMGSICFLNPPQGVMNPNCRTSYLLQKQGADLYEAMSQIFKHQSFIEVSLWCSLSFASINECLGSLLGLVPNAWFSALESMRILGTALGWSKVKEESSRKKTHHELGKKVGLRYSSVTLHPPHRHSSTAPVTLTNARYKFPSCSRWRI